MNNKFMKGFGVGGLLVAVIALVTFFGFGLKNKVEGAITSPPSNFSYILASQSVDSPLFRYALAVVNNVVTASLSEQAVQSTMSASATTTPCATQNPLNATSTLTSFSVNITTATSSAGQIVIATSTSPNATTSPVFTTTLPANQQGSFLVGETASSTGLGIVVPPAGWVVFGIGSGAPAPTGNYIYGGTCTAIFQGIAS